MASNPAASQRYRERNREKCRSAGRIATARRRAENPELVAAEYERSKAFIEDRNRRIIAEAKSTPCVDCGVQYPLVAMDLDHVRGEKSERIAVAVNRRWSEDRLLQEIAKCEVRCANCHRIRHYGGI